MAREFHKLAAMDVDDVADAIRDELRRLHAGTKVSRLVLGVEIDWLRGDVLRFKSKVSNFGVKEESR